MTKMHETRYTVIRSPSSVHVSTQSLNQHELQIDNLLWFVSILNIRENWTNSWCGVILQNYTNTIKQQDEQLYHCKTVSVSVTYQALERWWCTQCYTVDMLLWLCCFLFVFHPPSVASSSDEPTWWYHDNDMVVPMLLLYHHLLWRNTPNKTAWKAWIKCLVLVMIRVHWPNLVLCS